jgi:hypothetical protein
MPKEVIDKTVKHLSLGKDHPEVKNRLQEALQEDLGTHIKKRMASNKAYSILDSHPETQGSTWYTGGSGVLAHAIHKSLPGSKLVDVHNKNTGHTEHMAVHHKGHIYDANGATPAHKFIAAYKKRESPLRHHNLELTDHNPGRAKKSEIPMPKEVIDKTVKHLAR